MSGNANSGRRPQPNPLKVLRGNPGKRRLNPAEPQLPAPSPAFDAPPVELKDDALAAAEWRRLAPMLRQCGMVSEAERNVLLALVGQWSRYLQAEERLARSGLVVQGSAGQPLVNPFLVVADRALTQCRKLWTELGLTPSSRSRIIALPVAPVTSRWANLL